MNIIEKLLSFEDVDTLKAIKGKKLDYIRHNPMDDSGTILQVVEFAIGECRYYLYCDLETMDYFGLDEDISYISFSAEKYPFVDDCNLIENHIGLKVTGVSEVKDDIQLYDDEELEYDFSFTRGIIIHFGDYQLSIEKVSYFSELMTVRKGYDLISKFESIEEYRKDFDDECRIEVSRTVEQVC